MFPAASVARTETLCAPSASAAVVHGLVHVAHGPESTWHAKAELGSFEENANVGVLSSVGPFGPELSVVSGGVVSAGAPVSTVNERLAGDGSVLPATSVARTDTLCVPAASAAVVHGLVQSAHAPASARHSKTEFGSEAVNANVGVLSVVVRVGPRLIVVSGAVASAGGVASTVKERVAGVAPVLPAASVARTETLCDPSLSVGVVHGLVQSAHAPASTRHSKTAFDSEAVKANVGVLSPVEPVGPELIVVSGGVVSDAVVIVQVCVAGLASALPAASLARTLKVCGPVLSPL
jgi:hypothetical protein